MNQGQSFDIGEYQAAIQAMDDKKFSAEASALLQEWRRRLDEMRIPDEWFLDMLFAMKGEARKRGFDVSDFPS